MKVADKVYFYREPIIGGKITVVRTQGEVVNVNPISGRIAVSYIGDDGRRTLCGFGNEDFNVRVFRIGDYGFGNLY